MASWRPVFGLLLAVFITTVACYRLAKPVEGIGITMPGLFPPLLAAMSALLLVPDHAPPIAFVAGVLGPLIGADLLHLCDIEKIATGIALSNIVAAYLA